MKKTIKEIDTFRYRVELNEEGNAYKIEYTNKVIDSIGGSEIVTDYNIASFLFDLKVSELEGN